MIKEFKDLDVCINAIDPTSNCIMFQQDNLQVIIEIDDNKTIRSVYSTKPMDKIVIYPASGIKQLYNESVKKVENQEAIKHLREEYCTLLAFIDSEEAAFVQYTVEQLTDFETADTFISHLIPDRMTKLEYDKNQKLRFRLIGTRFVYQTKFDADEDLKHITNLLNNQ